MTKKPLYHILLDSGMDEAEAGCHAALFEEAGYIDVEALDPSHRAKEDRKHTAANIYRRPND